MTVLRRQGWKEIRDQIHGWILDRSYRAGDKLPRDEDIAARLGCARSTVQRAMKDLADAGIVERRRKGGTHVRPDPIARATLDIPVTRTEIEQRGGVYGYQLVRTQRLTTPPVIAATMGLTRAEEHLRVEALHLCDQRPFIFEDRWINLHNAPEILDVDLTCQNANEWLMQNKPYNRYDFRILAQSADAEIAHLLDVPVKSALLVTERTTWIDDASITTVRAIAIPGYQILAKS